MSKMIKGKTIEEVNILFDKFHKLCTGQEIEDEDTETLQVLSGVSDFNKSKMSDGWHDERSDT